MGVELAFGEWLKHRRKALGLTQDELARLVGCSAVALRKIEAEDRRPSVQIALRLTEFLRVEPKHTDAFVRFARGDLLAGQALPAPLEAGRGATSTPRTGLPGYLTTFVGRETEIAGVIDLILSEDTRLVTLIGPPGIGKTRLASRAAGELQASGRFEGGIGYVPLAEIEEGGQVLPAIAQSIGLEDPEGPGVADRLASAFGGATRLLVLDNFEHLLEAAPRVADLLRASPSVRALVTSRAPLRVEGEILFQVPPLAVPELEGLPAPEAVRRYSAIRLFEERARLARPDFAVTADTASTVTALCARLDGLPLAIELAAARVGMLPLPDLLARLGGKFVLHLEGLRERPARHRSMNEAVGWSYDLLDPEAQRAFRFLGVFLGGFTLEAAQAVCAPPGAAKGADVAVGFETIRVVTGLAEKGLLVPNEGPVGEARFGMLAVIREYSLTKQDEAGEAEDAGERHAAYCRGLVDMAEPFLSGPDQVAWLNRLGADQHNLRAALRWSLAKDVETGLAIASGLWRFWLVRSHVSEGREWLERLLAASAGSRDRPSEWRAKAGYVAANLASIQGDGPRARSLADECLAASRDTNNREVLAYSLAVAGDAAYKVNEFEWGDRLLRDGLEIFRREGNDSGAAFCLGSLAVLAVIRDDMGSSAPMRNECLALYRRLGDTWGIVQGLNQIGSLARIECKYVDSLAFHEEQLRLAKELGSSSAIALALNGLAWTARDAGDLKRSMEIYEQGLALSREAGNKWRIAGILNGMGVISRRQGDLARARVLLEESLALRLETGNAQYIAWGHYALGDVARSEGNWDAARQAYREALRVVQAASLKSDAAHILERLGTVADARGKGELAARILGAASRLREIVNCTLPPLEQADHEQDVAAVRGKLGEVEFERAWTEGVALDLDEAIRCGLDV